jgi:transposase-like protein
MARRARRTFTPEFKAEVALGVRTGTTPATEACRTHQPRPTLLAVWKATFRERLPVVFWADELRSSEAVRVADPERLVGPQTLELAALKSLDVAGWGHDQRRRVVARLADEYPARWRCRVLDCPRAGVRHPGSRRRRGEAP